MNTHSFRQSMVLVSLLVAIPWLSMVSANATDQPLGVATSPSETKQIWTETQHGTPPQVPAAAVSRSPEAWIGELEDSLNRYKASYPASNFNAYTTRLTTVKRAVSNGQKEVVRAEMGAWLKMLRTRANGISDIAADELFNYSVMVAPIAEYRIAVPPPVEYGMPILGSQ